MNNAAQFEGEVGEINDDGIDVNLSSISPLPFIRMARHYSTRRHTSDAVITNFGANACIHHKI